MERVLNHIDKKINETLEHPWYRLIRDEGKTWKERLAWTPYVIPFNMSYRDFNVLVVRGDPSTTDPFQKTLNEHSFEEEFHWHWLLEDMKTLGHNLQLDLVDTVRYIWSEDLTRSRFLPTRLAAMCEGAPTSTKFSVVESIENMSIHLFTYCKDIPVPANRELVFFAEHHWEAEAAHTTLDAEEPCKKIALSEEDRAHAIRTVDQLFNEFHLWFDEMMGLVDRYGTDTERGIKDVIARSWSSSTAQVQRYDAALVG